MEISSASFRIKDDYGLIIEIKSLSNVSSTQATNDISEFFGKYRIVGARKDTDTPESVKPKPKIDIPESKIPAPAKLLKNKFLEQIVREKLPNEFSVYDFIEYAKTHADVFGGYPRADIKKMWKSVFAHLRKNNKIVLANEKETNKHLFKYRYIGIGNLENRNIEALKNGKPVVIT